MRGNAQFIESYRYEQGKGQYIERESYQNKIHIKFTIGSTLSDGCGQMATAESWPLVGSWPCSLPVTKVRGELQKWASMLKALALDLKHRTRIKKPILIQQYSTVFAGMLTRFHGGRLILYSANYI